jgi:hypothetical protein
MKKSYTYDLHWGLQLLSPMSTNNQPIDKKEVLPYSPLE